MLKPRQEIAIAGRAIGPEHPVYLIAEMACGHQGDHAQAMRLVEVAVEAGADAIQFEIFRAPHNMVPQAPAYSLITRLEFSDEQWAALYRRARDLGIAVIGYSYDPPSLELARRLGSDAIKLNASDLCNPEMIVAAVRTGLPVTLGTGAATHEEMADTVALALANGGDQLVLMHGVQNFPTQVADAHARRIDILRRNYGCLVGYADHTDAADPLCHTIDLVALGAGAVVLEKHVVLERGKDKIDAAAALLPAEFKDYVALMRRASGALGASRLGALSASEEKYRRFQRKVIVAARDIGQGETVAARDLAFMRHSESGLPPTRAPELIGRQTRRAIARYETLLPEHLS